VAAFDPPSSGGNGEENDELAPSALADGNPATNWTTECYSGQYMGKAGTGLVVALSTSATGRIGFDVGNAPYTVDVYTSNEEPAPGSVAGWGGRLERATGTAPGRVEVDVTSGARYVLVLIMEPGQTSSGCSAGRPNQGSLGEITFTASP